MFDGGDWYGKNQLKLNTEKSDIKTTKRFALWYFHDNWWASSCAKAICTKPRSHTRQWTDYASAGCSGSKVLLSPGTSTLDKSGQASLMMHAKPWYTRVLLHASTTRMRCYTAFCRQRCIVCNMCKTALPGSSAILENTTTSHQYCSICTGYRFVCAWHIKCFYLLIRLCMTKHRVTSRNYCHVVNPIADWGLRLCRYWHYLLRRRSLTVIAVLP